MTRLCQKIRGLWRELSRPYRKKILVKLETDWVIPGPHNAVFSAGQFVELAPEDEKHIHLVDRGIASYFALEG